MFKKCKGIHRKKRLGSKMARASKKDGDRVGVGLVAKQVVKGNDPHGDQGLVWVRDIARAGVKHRKTEVRLLCYRWSGYIEDSIQLSERGKIWKSRILFQLITCRTKMAVFKSSVKHFCR
jgi:hypothetical protein